MYHVTIKNCNSIVHGELQIERGKLIIFNGINGTGKTTIAKALESSKSPDQLAGLQSFISNSPAFMAIHPEVGKILVFNDDFVNNIVFVENEVIQNSFDVFLKTEKYTDKYILLFVMFFETVLRISSNLNTVSKSSSHI